MKSVAPPTDKKSENIFLVKKYESIVKYGFYTKEFTSKYISFDYTLNIFDALLKLNIPRLHYIWVHNIIGEEHNQELTNSSIFHKIKSFLDKKKLSKNPPLVLLEHPSLLCKNGKNISRNFSHFGTNCFSDTYNIDIRDTPLLRTNEEFPNRFRRPL